MQGPAHRLSGSGSDQAEKDTNSARCCSAVVASSDVLASTDEKILMFACDTRMNERKSSLAPPSAVEMLSSTTMELTDANRVFSFGLVDGHTMPRQAPTLTSQWERREEPPPLMDVLESGSDAFPKRISHGSRIRSIWQPRGSLTLSAFRRPETAVRLTQTDPNRHLETEYSLQAGRVLGHGAFSTVRLAFRKQDGVKVAIKSIAKHEALRSRRLRMQTTDTRHYLEEWEILRRLKGNPYVIDLLDVFETNEEIQLVTEYCPGGELFDAIKKKQRRNRSNNCEIQAAQITSQILQALVALHSEGIVHRDVKPENILLAKPNVGESVHVKLCDFGVARPLSRSIGKIAAEGSSSDSVSDGEASPLTPRSRSFSTVGSDYYAAPELACGGRYDTSVDIYSLGVTLYVLLCGFPPVFSNFAASDSDDSDVDELKIAHGEVLFPAAYWKNISDGAKGLLRAMLHPEPSLRITAREALRDAWIREAACAPVQSRSIIAEASPPTQSPLVDLDIVRHELYKTLGRLHSPASFDPVLSIASSAKITRNNSKVSNGRSVSRPRKRARHRHRQVERRASATALMALADLYRGVAAPLAAAAAVAAAGTETTSSLAPSHVHDDSSPQGSFAASQIAALSF